MKRTIRIVLIVFALLVPHVVRAQSVAQTLETLSAKVARLETAPPATAGNSSPFVIQGSTDTGGRLLVNTRQNQTHALLASTADGGNLWLYNNVGGLARLGVQNSSQQVSLEVFNNQKKRTIGLGNFANNGPAGALWFYDPSGEKNLAYFGVDAAGTAGRVVINGVAVHDYAEVFDIADCGSFAPGSVVSAAADGSGIRLARTAYDRAAVGVISGAGSYQPGMQIGSRADGTSNWPVAVAGQVFVRVNAEGGGIAVGDLLVSSSEPGVAMRGADNARLVGTVIGKALDPYHGKQESLIRMLVLNR